MWIRSNWENDCAGIECAPIGTGCLRRQLNKKTTQAAWSFIASYYNNNMNHFDYVLLRCLVFFKIEFMCVACAILGRFFISRFSKAVANIQVFICENHTVIGNINLYKIQYLKRTRAFTTANRQKKKTSIWFLVSCEANAVQK